MTVIAGSNAVMRLNFTKMHGLGNDFVLVDARREAIALSVDRIRHIADRRCGIGCDQVLLIEPATNGRADARYRVYNADGSVAANCGNGIRCVAVYLEDEAGTAEPHVDLEIGAEVRRAYLEGAGVVRVDMGRPRLEPADIPLLAAERRRYYPIRIGEEELMIGAVSMGNAHAVIEVEDTDRAPVSRIGCALQRHADFPDSVNVGFMQILSRDRIRLRVYERGAGETPACGTGACAAVVVGRARGRLAEDVSVELPGGQLAIGWSGEAADSVWMSGPAVRVFDGKMDL